MKKAPYLAPYELHSCKYLFYTGHGTVANTTQLPAMALRIITLIATPEPDVKLAWREPWKTKSFTATDVIVFVIPPPDESLMMSSRPSCKEASGNVMVLLVPAVI